MKNEKERESVIEKYNAWKIINKKYWQTIKNIKKVSEKEKIKEIHLYCWCYPKACHAEIIKSDILHLFA